MTQREKMEVDVLIIGAGPAGLSTAIRLAQLAQDNEQTLSICVLEKGSEVGAHSLSGAVFEPRALNELLPNWRELGAPLNTTVNNDSFVFLTQKKTMKLPTPPQMRNHGNYIISLGNLCRWLAEQAANLGIEIYPGFAATEILFDDNNTVCGVATGDMGIDKDGNKSSNYQPGMELHAKYTVFAEGCRGSLTKALHKHYDYTPKQPQTYGIGLKEIWRVPAEQHSLGSVVHTIGWPLDSKTYGGSFIYHIEDNQVAVGFVIGLDYRNPYLNPFKEFQRFKTHPAIRPLLENGERLAYGARALNEGGFQSIPQLTYPGALIVGCAAGFLNVPKIKGNHTAMKSGMLAAETVFEAIKAGQSHFELNAYHDKLKNSWVWKELRQARNIRPAFKTGLWLGLMYSAIDTYLLRGRAPWTLKHHVADHQCLKPASKCKPINYPKPDGVVSFDLLSSVYISNTNHEENQPPHLRLLDANVPIDLNLKVYDAPETRYCPAGVYEIVDENGNKRLQINAQNCVHCKTCDIKDPSQNINWVPPEGGGGPNYPNM